jgi:anhydro-N-acetylmuramic acid kinase
MLVAGLMSGTSADGIDVALVEITGLEWKTHFRLVAFGEVAFPLQVRRRVLEIAGGQKATAGEISQLNFLLGELFAEACRNVCRRARVPMKRLSLIGSHGQTVYHQSRASSFCGREVRSTFQIGDAAVIAERTGVTTVGDFRPADMAAGGQGAPLVPFFDYLLYRHARSGRVILNVGGIANITAIPGGGSLGDVIAFDTGPGNMLLDALAARATGGRLAYDRDGSLARRGVVSDATLRRLMRIPYFHERPPKTTGREEFGEELLKRYFRNALAAARGRVTKKPPQALLDALATATAFTAESIARATSDFVLPRFAVAECIVSGGGARNPVLMEELRRRLNANRHSHRGIEPQRNAGAKERKIGADSKAIEVIASDDAGVPSGAKEAVAFAVLAYHTFHRRASNVPAATGARHPAILGKIAYASEEGSRR